MLQEKSINLISMPGDVREFFRQTGSQGGKKRAAMHDKEELRAWGKLGGRPRKDASGNAKRPH
jgi:general stress protein YciG